MNLNNFEKVKFFNQTFGILVNEEYDNNIFTEKPGVVKYRLDLINEETSELEEGCKKKSFIEVLDAICDILYVVYGFGTTVGLDLDKEFKTIICGSENINLSNFEICEQSFDSNTAEKFTGTLDVPEYDGIVVISQQIREICNQLIHICNNPDGDSDKMKNIVSEMLVSIIRFCYCISSLIKVDANKAFNLVHEANMTKACETEEVAQASVDYYLKEKENYTGDDEYPYQFPEYRLSDNGKYWIVFNNDKRDKPRYAGKILKSINWREPDFSEYIV